jgi:biopolymer transport protein TolQ
VADGIAEALITTQAGLIAAIPLILGHLYLSNRYKKIIARIQEGTARALNYIEEHGA